MCYPQICRTPILELLLAMRSTIHYFMLIHREFEMTSYLKIWDWMIIPKGDCYEI